MDDDDRFTAVMHRAVSTLEPDTARLVAGGLARGRRRRRLVRGAEALSAVVVLAGVAGLVVALLPGHAPGHRGQSGDQVPAAGSPVPPAAATDVTVTPQALLQTALDLLPRPGTTSHYAGNASDQFVGASFVYDDGHGAAAVDVALTFPTSGPNPKSPSIQPCTAGTTGCTVLRDGAHVLTRQGHQYKDGRQPNAAEWDLDLVREDGVQVSFIEWNAAAPKDAVISRPEPPFSPAELTAWADSSRWQAHVSQADADAAAHLFTTTPPPPANGSIASTKAQLRQNCSMAKLTKKAPPAYCH